MKFSIVTISYNQAPFLRACIDSVLTQGYSDVEYIVVDPGSSDGSRAIIESYGDRIVKIFQPDKGPADGLNQGFSLATGDVLAFINSDDMLAPNAIDKVARAFRTHDADVICGAGNFVDANGAVVGKAAPSRMHPWLYVYGAVTLFQQGMFFKRGAFERVGGFNPLNRTSWDGELFLDMALAGASFRIVTDKLASFRLQDDSITVSGRFREAQKLDRARLFERVTGRQKRGYDAVIAKAARLGKFVVDPSYLFRRGFGPPMSF